ncbi:MAG: NitrOD5 domain-containing protein [Candidatus Bathyarchaeia archaeon]
MKTTQQTNQTPIEITATNQKTNLEKLLNEAIDQALTKLCPQTKQAIYAHLEKQHRLSPQTIAKQPEKFVQAIERTFGPPAKLIEIEILKQLHNRVPEFKYAPKKPNLSFAKYVKALKAFIDAY